MKTFSYKELGINNSKQIGFSSGYISPEGIFYDSYDFSKADDKHCIDGHNYFARKYVEEILNSNIDSVYNEVKSRSFIPELRTDKDKLIHLFGFVSYTFNRDNVKHPIVLLPSAYFNGKEITRKQEELLLSIWEEYNFDYDDLFSYMIHSNAKRLNKFGNILKFFGKD